MNQGPLTSHSRRHMLAGSAALLTSLALGADKVAADGHINKNELYAKLRGDPKNVDGLWAYSGAYWGKPQGEIAQQLFRVDGYSVNKITMRPDGGIDQHMIECGFWQDPETGELADQWVNPMNGLPCEPRHFRSSQVLSFDANGQVELPADMDPSAHMEAAITEPVVIGPVIWSQERLLTRFVRPVPEEIEDPLTYGGPVRTGTSLASFQANIADLDRDFVPSTLHYQSMGGFYPWMRMGQRAGTCGFELLGYKLQSPDEIPDRVRGFLEDRQPGFIEDPWA